MVDNFLLLPQLPQEAGLGPGPGGRLLLTVREAWLASALRSLPKAIRDERKGDYAGSGG